jgi:hypothetical protein
VSTEPEAVQELISHTKGKTWEDFFALAQQVKDKSGGKTKLVADAGTDVYGGALRQGGEGYFDGMKVMIEEKPPPRTVGWTSASKSSTPTSVGGVLTRAAGVRTTPLLAWSLHVGCRVV